MCVYKNHVFIYFLRPPPWLGTSHIKHKKLKLKKFNFNTFLTVLFRPFFEFLHVCHTSVDVRDKCSKTVNKLELLETRLSFQACLQKILLTVNLHKYCKLKTFNWKIFEKRKKKKYWHEQKFSQNFVRNLEFQLNPRTF